MSEIYQVSEPLPFEHSGSTPASTSIFHAHLWSYTAGGINTLIPLSTSCTHGCGLTYERYLRLLAGEVGA